MEIGKKYLVNVCYKCGIIERFVIAIKKNRKEYLISGNIRNEERIEYIEIIGEIND